MITLARRIEQTLPSRWTARVVELDPYPAHIAVEAPYGRHRIKVTEIRTGYLVATGAGRWAECADEEDVIDEVRRLKEEWLQLWAPAAEPGQVGLFG